MRAKTNPENEDFGAVRGEIVCVSHNRPDAEVNFTSKDDEWLTNTEGLSLEPGLYRLKVATEDNGTDAPNPVNKLFEVADLNI